MESGLFPSLIVCLTGSWGSLPLPNFTREHQTADCYPGKTSKFKIWITVPSECILFFVTIKLKKHKSNHQRWWAFCPWRSHQRTLKHFYSLVKCKVFSVPVMDWMFVSLAKLCWNSTRRCDCIRLWGLREVIRIRWGFTHNRACFTSALCHVEQHEKSAVTYLEEASHQSWPMLASWFFTSRIQYCKV